PAGGKGVTPRRARCRRGRDGRRLHHALHRPRPHRRTTGPGPGPRRPAVASALMSWLPDDFVHPVHVPVPGTALHLRPIREADTAIDYPAVMGSRERLFDIF